MRELKKKVDSLGAYYFQWMNKYKDDADRRLDLLERAYRIIELHSPNNTFLEILEKEIDATTDAG